jgi:hypothetical protein
MSDQPNTQDRLAETIVVDIRQREKPAIQAKIE